MPVGRNLTRRESAPPQTPNIRGPHHQELHHKERRAITLILTGDWIFLPFSSFLLPATAYSYTTANPHHPSISPSIHPAFAILPSRAGYYFPTYIHSNTETPHGFRSLSHTDVDISLGYEACVPPAVCHCATKRTCIAAPLIY